MSGGNGEEKMNRSAAAAVVPSKHRRRYERSFSPPRSSNSSGYGTGSSSKSFADPRFPANPEVCIHIKVNNLKIDLTCLCRLVDTNNEKYIYTKGNTCS